MTRPVFFLAGLLVVASLGLVVWLAVAPSPAPATAPVAPVSVCERALAANLTVAYRALIDYQHGRARAGRDLWLSRTAALPVGCGR